MITHRKSGADDDEEQKVQPGFRGAAQLVDQGYTLKAACEAMGVGKSTMEYWVRDSERSDPARLTEGEALTPEQREIQELKRKLRRVEEEKEILKRFIALYREMLLLSSERSSRYPGSRRPPA